MKQDIGELVEACKEGKRWALKAIYENYYGVFFPVSRRYMGTREEALEALNDAFVKIFEKIDKYDGTGSFEGWMKRVLINHCLDLLRKRKTQVSTVELKHPPEGYSTQGSGEEQMEYLYWLLQKLPLQHQQVFNLYVLDGYSHKEISEHLNISVSNSKYCLHQARKSLQDLYSNSLVNEK